MSKKFFTGIVLVLALHATSSQAFGSRPPSGGGGGGGSDGGAERPPPSKYGHLDPKRYINREALQAAVDYYDANQSKFTNKNYMTVIDFSLHSGKYRFFVINMSSGEVARYKTAHGSGGDRDHDGYAESFSNVSGSNQSSLGAYKTGSHYTGSHGYSMYLDGLSSTNSRARSRAIVVHPADYVDESASKMGRSWGCPALDPDVSRGIIDKIKGGSLMYAWTE
jgi:hypothetical protein